MKAKYNNVYVFAPYKLATGGIELAHQLVHTINQLGGNAYVVYETGGKIVEEPIITPQYADYDIKTTSQIIDDADNFLVLPEVYYDWIKKFNNLTIGCWWMSVDNFFRKCHWIESFKFQKSLKEKLVWARHCYNKKCKTRLSDFVPSSDRIIHFYQSAYAQNFLYNHSISNLRPLSDYINPSLLESKTDFNKEDIILYNPSKGYKFTSKIINSNPNLKFIPLKGLSRDELKNLLQKAKLYIDFGHFPGKDRLSREAVVNGCCILTGTLGASFFYEDVPIECKYKFDVSKSNLFHISATISDILENYESHSPHFNEYRRSVHNEEDNFILQTKKIFFND